MNEFENKSISLAEQIAEFVNDPDIHLFETRFKQTTDIFEAIVDSRAETIHSKFIKWLLDPNTNPGLWYRPLNYLLGLIRSKLCNSKFNESSSCFDDYDISLLVGDYEFSCNKLILEYPVDNNGEKGRIDILICLSFKFGGSEDKNINIVIENKVESDTHDAQLIKYFQAIENEYTNDKNIFILLAPNPEQITERHNKYMYISYQELYDYILSPILLDPETNVRAKVLIEEYVHTLSKIEHTKTIKLIAMSDSDKILLKSFFQKHGSLINDMLHAYQNTMSDGNPEEIEQKEQINNMIQLVNDITESSKASYTYTINGKPLRYISDLPKEVVSLYINEHPNISFDELKITFKDVDNMISPKLFINVQEWDGNGYKRWKLAGSLSNGEKVYTSSQWRSTDMPKFEAFVKKNFPSITIDKFEN